jgi:hypothetical protein
MKKLANYKNFLSDRDLYSQNVNLWKEIITSLSGDRQFEEWVSTKFANGQDFFDGNPIFSALYEQLNKAVRIIQIEKDTYTPELRVWVENVQHDHKPIIKELLIIIQPSNRALESAKSIITAFLKGSPITKYITHYNALYKNKAGQARAESAIATFENNNRHLQNYKLKQTGVYQKKVESDTIPTITHKHSRQSN